MYALSSGALVRSIDGGATFSGASLSNSNLSSVVIEPGNNQVLFVASYDKGVLKSGDGGATWTAMNNGLPVQAGGVITAQDLWIDPTNPAVLLTQTTRGLARTSDGAATWRFTTITDNILDLTFDLFNPSVIYVCAYHVGFMKSTDGGQTFQAFNAPSVSEVFPDQIHSGRLIGAGPDGLFESTDGGSTWTQRSTTAVSPDLVQDTVNNLFYAATAEDRGVVQISGDLRSATPVGPRATAFVRGLAVANGQLYATNDGSADVFVTEIDPLGNIVYSTYFGGTANDSAAAMTVDAAGNVFVTGTTGSLDFQVGKGAYASSGSAFIFKLNPDGSLGYSTYFSGTNPMALATEGSGSVWLAGTTQGGLPVTPGALATTFCCTGQPVFSIGPTILSEEASLTRFDSSGSSLVFPPTSPVRARHPFSGRRIQPLRWQWRRTARRMWAGRQGSSTSMRPVRLCSRR